MCCTCSARNSKENIREPIEHFNFRIETYVSYVQAPRAQIGADHELYIAILKVKKVVKSFVAVALREQRTVHVVRVQKFFDEHSDRLSVCEYHRLAGALLELIAQVEQFVGSDRSIDSVEDVLHVKQQVVHLGGVRNVDVLQIDKVSNHIVHVLRKCGADQDKLAGVQVVLVDKLEEEAAVISDSRKGKKCRLVKLTLNLFSSSETSFLKLESHIVSTSSTTKCFILSNE